MAALDQRAYSNDAKVTPFILHTLDFLEALIRLRYYREVDLRPV